MSKPLNDTALLELIPHSIANDQAVQDMAQAIQPDIDIINESIPLIELYSRLDELPDGILHMLAWENKMGGPEWVLATTREDKINLIRNSFELNKRRGTRWSVERIFTLLRFRPEIVEWWEESPQAQPYTFKIRVLDVADRGLSLDQLKLIEQLIFMYKPLRSWLTELGLTLSANLAPVLVGATTQHGVLDVYPMGYGAKTVDFGYTAHAKNAITMSGVLDVSKMPYGEQTVDFGLEFKATRATTIKGVLDVGPQAAGAIEADATVTKGVATYTKFKIRRD